MTQSETIPYVPRQKKEAETTEGQPHGIEVWTVTQKEPTGAVFP
jgi:hypothetical protein